MRVAAQLFYKIVFLHKTAILLGRSSKGRVDFLKDLRFPFPIPVVAPALSLAFCRRKHKKCKKSTSRASLSIVKKIKLDLKASLRDGERCEAAVCNRQARFCF